VSFHSRVVSQGDDPSGVVQSRYDRQMRNHCGVLLQPVHYVLTSSMALEGQLDLRAAVVERDSIEAVELAFQGLGESHSVMGGLLGEGYRHCEGDL
jgi:hypothetical protein